MVTTTVTAAASAPSSALRSLTARRRAGVVVSAAVLALLVVGSIAIGANPLPLEVVWAALQNVDPALPEHLIVVEQRVPRTVLALVVGAALGVAGALMQGMTRNPLADPGLLGVSAGASFAMTLAVALLPITSLFGYIWFAFLGAVVATVAVYLLGTGRRGANPLTLTLAGVSLGAVLSGLTLSISLLDARTFRSIRVWESGSLADRGWEIIGPVAGFIVVGPLFAAGAARGLNAVALGDDLAVALGADARRTRLCVVIAVTLLCGAATAAMGPAWFVGLMVPHVARWICGPDQRWIIGLCALLGPALILAADVLGRVLVRPDELQAGLVTAFLGAPVLIALVRRSRARAL